MSEEQNTQAESAPIESAESQTPENSGQAQQAAPTPLETKKMLKQLQYKLDGQDMVEDLPFEIEEKHADWYRKNLGLAKKAQKSMHETANIKAQAEQYHKFLHSDTRNALLQQIIPVYKKYNNNNHYVSISDSDRSPELDYIATVYNGIDPKDFAASLIEDEMKLQAMSPEQREMQELKAKYQAQQEEREKEKKQSEDEKYERLVQQEHDRIESKLASTLEKSGLPKEAYVIKKMVDYMTFAAHQGVNLEPEDVIDVVKEEIQSDLRQMLQALGEDKVEQFIGKETLDKIRKKNIQKAKATPATVKAGLKDVGSTKSPAKKDAPAMSIKDFFKI